MRFSNGAWLVRDGFTVEHPTQVRDIVADPQAGTLTVFAPVRRIRDRGDTHDTGLVTVTYSSPAQGVVRVRIAHFDGGLEPCPRFALASEPGFAPQVEAGADTAELRSGDLVVRVRRGDGWNVDIISGTRVLTSSIDGSVGVATGPDGLSYVHEQLTLQPGESIYGLGERFGPLVKNGQSVDVWNSDGGTSSEQAYKNVPFYLTSRGYGVFVDHPELVSFEIGSHVVTRAQFSVEGQVLEYLIIDGPTPKDVLTRYTALTGRPPRIPAWSFGLWLSTSFVTDYDENTVTGFIDGMAERDLPLSVFHFDCFWMREFHWCDFEWDPATFPEPEAMLARLKAKGLRICVWINPYIAQRSRLFEEGKAKGYLVRNVDGSVWQWDRWQAGMGLVDFTNPGAVAWYQGELNRLLEMGVDCFKTDFGERIPVDGVVYHDGSDPKRMHNYYTQLYNGAVFDVLREQRGDGEAVVFARSATAGGQQFPVHWGGDNHSSLVSMAETLRGGLSLALSGFGFWSHDIGGFEGAPDPVVFKRWLPFGLLSSHSRLHGESSVRVPWAFDDEAVDVTRRFTHLKHALMPYIAGLAEEAYAAGIPVMRPMVLEFPDDRSTHTVDTQYMLGDRILVAPVFSQDGTVDVYVPDGTWTSLLDGSTVTGPRWVQQRHGFESLPVLVRPGTVLPIGAEVLRPDYEWADGVTLRVFELEDGASERVVVPAWDRGGSNGALAGGGGSVFVVRRKGTRVTATGPKGGSWRLQVGDAVAQAAGGTATLTVG